MNLFIFSLLSVFVSAFSIYLITKIFRKIYDEEYKRPWLFIGLCALTLACSQIILFFESTFQMYMFSSKEISKVVYELLVVCSNLFLGYGILLEFYILRYFKSKTIKLKFIPTTEGNMEGDIDLNVDFKKSYICYNEKKKYVLKEVSRALKRSFQGFFLTEDKILKFRKDFSVVKSPVCYIHEIKDVSAKKQIIEISGENSDVVDPFELNNILIFIDNFLERAKKPIICMDLNLIFYKNNYTISKDFVLYIVKKIEKFNSIAIFFIDENKFEKSLIDDLNSILNKLDE